MSKKCQWCGKTIKRAKAKQKYHTLYQDKECYENRMKYNWSKASRTYRKRYPEEIRKKEKGTGQLGPKPQQNPNLEYQMINKELIRLGLRKESPKMGVIFYD